MSDPAITEIELYRGPCFGTCPVFRVTFSRDGTYHFEGQSHIDPLGHREGPFPEWLFDRVAAVCDALGVLSLADAYPSNFEDGSTTVVRVRHAGGVKVIRCEAGDGSVPRLWAFAVVVEYAMREAFAIEDRDRRSVRRCGRA